MEYIGIVFGIFGLFAYLQVCSLKHRVESLEEQLTKTKGTPLYEDRRALLQAAKSYIGKQVELDLKEDHEDVDVVMYGNTKHGSNTILDVDEDWMLVQIEGPKGTKNKLIRMESIQRISLIRD
ncbi:MAG: hypothetical protein IKE43_03815 [Coriobacteriales bacterium]|nr:hypothetical protein [Coriobacteriales bacterium]